MTTTMSKMSKTARNYYLHDLDKNHDTGERVCYFSERAYDESGWGIWIDKSGNVDADETSASGGRPSSRLLEILKVAARKQLT